VGLKEPGDYEKCSGKFSDYRWRTLAFCLTSLWIRQLSHDMPSFIISKGNTEEVRIRPRKKHIAMSTERFDEL
jgi:hypothetical protein